MDLKSNLLLKSKAGFSSVGNSVNKNNKSLLKESLFEKFANPSSLKTAWFEIKGKPGNLTSGSDKNQEILKKLIENWFEDVSQKLLDGSYKYAFVKLVYISSKKNTKNKKVLKIESLRDKVLQKSLLNVLTSIYEGQHFFKKCSVEEYRNIITSFNAKVGSVQKKLIILKKKISYSKLVELIPVKFSEFSHGFRPNRSVHTALKNIKIQWKPVTYFAGCDITKAFDKVNYKILINEIKINIKDQRISDEIKKMLNVKSICFNFKKEFRSNSLTTPQGSVLSLFLFNMYMSRLDNFIEKLIKQNQKGIWKTNTKWTKIIRICDTSIPVKKRLKQWQILRKKALQNGIKKTKITKTEKLYYCRYVDDLFLGFVGEKKKFKQALTEIQTFIESDLKLCTTDFCISSAISDSTSFLGFSLKFPQVKAVIHKRKETRQFQKLRLITKIKKSNEFNKYIRLLEWAGKKYFKDFIIKYIRKSSQILINKSKLIQQLKKYGENEALKFLKSSLSEMEKNTPKIKYEFFSTLPRNPHLECALEFRQWQFTGKIREWVTKAESLANESFNEKMLEILDLKTKLAIGEARSQFLNALDKVEHCKTKSYVVKLITKNTFNDFSIKVVSHYKLENLAKKQTFISSIQQIKLLANIKDIEKKLVENGVLDKNNRPIANTRLINLKDHIIIEDYRKKGMRLLSFYSCADNISQLKVIVNYKLRYSLASTLARKHKTSVNQIFQKYRDNITIEIIFSEKMKNNSKKNEFKCQLSSYLSKDFVNTYQKKFLVDVCSYSTFKKIFEKNRLKKIA